MSDQQRDPHTDREQDDVQDLAAPRPADDEAVKGGIGLLHTGGVNQVAVSPAYSDQSKATTQLADGSVKLGDGSV